MPSNLETAVFLAKRVNIICYMLFAQACKMTALFFIKFYQRSLSLIIPASCRFVPTCSEYTKQAIEKYGTCKGTLKGLARVLCCHPLCRGGWDPLK